MAEEKTYLELSEEGGSAHKFYEVAIDGPKVTVRFGRIGDAGQSKSTVFADAQKAQVDAQKKLVEKTRKGYARATAGARAKRSVTRREIVSQVSTSSQAPLLWKFQTGAGAYGLFVDEARCWVGNESGSIVSLGHEGQVLGSLRLNDGVKCIVADDEWLYAGSDDGNVYDLSGKVPRLAYQIANDIDIYWIDIRDGVLGVSDAIGNITTINHEEESRWKKKSAGNSGWMVRCDELGVYHGHSEGVTMYDWEDGRVIWHQPTRGQVQFGWQEESSVYAGTTDSKVHRFTKNGGTGQIYDCDQSVFSCATAEDGKFVFAGDNHSSVYCFDASGKRLWKLGTGVGSAYSMQYFRERLYLVTTDGSLACMDVSESALAAAKRGLVPVTRHVAAPPPAPVAAHAAVETTRDSSKGVVVECFAESGKAHLKVVSPGYNPALRVQFPRDIREVGARYVVREVRPSVSGGFYRVLGDIRKLIP